MSGSTNGQVAQEEVTKLEKQISQSTEEAKTYLDQVTKQLQQYDEQYKVSETASSYMQPALDRSRQSLESLREVSMKIQEQGTNTSASLMQTAKGAVEQAKTSFEGLKVTGKEYDDKFRASVTSAMDATGTTPAFQQVKEQVSRIQELIGQYSTAAAGTALQTAGSIDERYGVSQAISGAASSVSSTVSSWDQSLGVSSTVAKVDHSVSGGMGANLVQKGTELMSNGVEYVNSSLASVKAPTDNPSAVPATETTPETKTL